MIGTAFAPEPLPSAESLRGAIEALETSHFERVACRCSLFYQEALVDLHSRSVPDANVIRACMEALLAASACILECGVISSEAEFSKDFGNVAGYGFVQALAQIVEAITGLEDALDIDVKRAFGHKPTIKDREYWNFRNRHTHVVETHK